MGKGEKDQDSDVSEAATKVLGEIGADAKEAVPALISLLKDEDSDVREATETALRKIRRGE